MDPKKEVLKLEAILSQGKFKYNGAEYVLEREFTDANRDNFALIGKPLKKLCGVDKKGNMVNVWSHDCQTVAHVVGKVKEPELVSTDTLPKVQKDSAWTKKSGHPIVSESRNDITGEVERTVDMTKKVKSGPRFIVDTQPTKKLAKKAPIPEPKKPVKKSTSPSHDFTNKPQILKPLRKAPPKGKKK